MRRKQGEKPPRPDLRKISKLFRAVERDDRPRTYYGYLVSDDRFRVVCFAAHDGDESVFQERTLIKREYSFSEIDSVDFAIHVNRALYRMNKEASDQKMEFEAAEAKAGYAKEKFNEIMGD